MIIHIVLVITLTFIIGFLLGCYFIIKVLNKEQSNDVINQVEIEKFQKLHD